MLQTSYQAQSGGGQPAAQGRSGAVGEQQSQNSGFSAVLGQSNVVAQWSQEKLKRLRGFAQYAQGRPHVPVFVSAGIFDQATETGSLRIFELTTITALQAGAVYILNNNDVAKAGHGKLADLAAAQPGACVCVWDFDNHHAFDSSGLLALFASFYAPCHPHNLAVLSRLNPMMLEPVCAGVIQWSKAILQSNRGMIEETERNVEPLGLHVLYQEHHQRNLLLKSLSQHFKHVGGSSLKYHDRDERARLSEWCGHMSHWIVPVNADLPIRAFDALVTGGIPILPKTLEKAPGLAPVLEHVFFYDDDDIQTPWRITEAANDYFVKHGRDGIRARHELTLETSHVDARIQEILSQVYARLQQLC